MRVLKFIVNDLVLAKDPNCDYDDLIAGTEDYLQADFSFSDDWFGYIKAVGFSNARTGKEYLPQYLRDNKSCIIPTNVLANKEFYIWVIGKKDGLKIKTNKITVTQNGGRV